jgi:uncharacterized protein (AIM24 family)
MRTSMYMYKADRANLPVKNMETPSVNLDQQEMAAFKTAVRAIASIRDEKSEMTKRLAALNKIEKQHMRIVIPFMTKNGLTEVKLQPPYNGRILLEEKVGKKTLTRDHVLKMAREVVDDSRAERLAKRVFEDRQEVTRVVLQRVRDADSLPETIGGDA